MTNQVSTFEDEIFEFLKVDIRLFNHIKALDFSGLWNDLEIELDHIEKIDYNKVENLLTSESEMASKKSIVTNSEQTFTEKSEIGDETDNQDSKYDVFLKVESFITILFFKNYV